MIKKIGTFQTSSDVLRISDPCYDKKVWCTGTLKNCKVGEWSAFIKYSFEGAWGTRVAEIIAVFGDLSINGVDELLNISLWENSNISVGVDSGQCGIFDESKYPKGKSTGEYGDSKTFYGKCCDLTLGHDQGGVIDFGAVSGSGYGDGSYDCMIFNPANEISAVRIIFIPDEVEEDEDSEEFSNEDDELTDEEKDYLNQIKSHLSGN